MRAALLAAPRRFELREVARPDPGPGQVRIRLEGCGVCGSNLPPWQGRPWFRYPLTMGEPGHEGWGAVAAVGRGVGAVREGDRVALLSTASFADEEVAPAELVVPLPAGISGPFPGEALGCAVNVVRRSRVRAGEAVAVVGAGFLGLAVIRLASLAGARVLAVSRRPTGLALAQRLGAAEVLPLEGAAAAIAERTGGRGCEVVIEAVGAQAAQDLASAAVREGGRLVIAGFHQDGMRTVDLCAWNWRGLDIVNAHERDLRVRTEGVAEAARLAAAGLLDPAPLCQSFPLDQVGAAFRAMEERPQGFVKAIIRGGVAAAEP
jgi:threonine dehydrogenase-like Zn-dependent dehydrogenase